MKTQRPKDDAVVDLAFKGVDRILKENVGGVDVVGEGSGKKGGQLGVEGGDRAIDLGLIGHNG